MNLLPSENIILHILNGKPGLGKTAIMKIIYFLQQVKQMKLGYAFDIYTYGPYAAEVTDELDKLISNGLVLSTVYNYSDYVGYKLNVSEIGKTKMGELVVKDEENLHEVLNFAARKSAKDLELCSTIIFIHQLYLKNKITHGKENGKNTIINKVHEIKPHFEEQTILEAYNQLDEMKYIQS